MVCVSLEKIIEIAQAFAQEALSKVPVEKVQEFFTLLQEIITTAKGLGVDMPVSVKKVEEFKIYVQDSIDAEVQKGERW